MRKIIILILIVITASVYGLTYDSQRLLKLGTELHLAEYVLPGYSDTCLLIHSSNHKIRVEIDSCGTISHIGYYIFPDSVQLHENQIVQRFIERYVLEALLHNDRSFSLQKVMQNDGVRFYAGTWKDLLKLDMDASVNMSFNEDDILYRITIRRDEQIVCDFSFPKDYQLLSGKDKLELDDQLFHPCQIPSATMNATEINQLFVHDMPMCSYKVVDGDHFFSPQLSRTMYVQKNDSHKLLFSPHQYPEETIANIMLCGNEIAYNLSMTHHRYGYNTITDTIPLNVWINLARAEGCVPYWGVQNNDGELVEGTYVWVNKSLGYLHVLFVRFPLHSIRSPKEPIECTIHSYVRISNVASLFAEKNITYTK